MPPARPPHPQPLIAALRQRPGGLRLRMEGKLQKGEEGPLHFAVRHDLSPDLIALLAGHGAELSHPVPFMPEWGRGFGGGASCPLSMAFFRNNPHTVGVLLAMGASPGVMATGQDPLSVAVSKASVLGDHRVNPWLDVMAALVARGATPAQCQAALRFAKSRETLEALAALGTDMRTPDSGGSHFLLTLAGGARADLVAHAVARWNLDVNHAAAGGITALFRAIEGGEFHRDGGNTGLAMVRTLLELGAAVGAVTAEGETPLMEAARSFPAAIPLLMMWGADPAVFNNTGQDAMDIAKAVDHLDPGHLDHVRKGLATAEAHALSRSVAPATASVTPRLRL